MWDYIGWPEYAALSSITALGIVLLNWAWIRKLTPSGRFKELEPLLDSLNRSRPDWSREKMILVWIWQKCMNWKIDY